MTVRFASIIALMLASASAPVPAPGPATGTPAPAGVPGETPGTSDTGGSPTDDSPGVAARPALPPFAPRLSELPLLTRPQGWQSAGRPGWEALIAAGPANRQAARWAYANTQIAQGRAQEAIGALDVMRQDEPDLMLVPAFRLALGATLAMLDRATLAVDALTNDALTDNPEACAWRMLAFARGGLSGPALGQVNCAVPALNARAAAARAPFLLAAARAAADLGKPAMTIQLLETLPDRDPAANLLRGRATVALGDEPGGRLRLGRARESGDYGQRIDADLSLVELAVQAHRRARDDAGGRVPPDRHPRRRRYAARKCRDTRDCGGGTMTNLLIHSMTEFTDLILGGLELAGARHVVEIGAEFGGMSQVLADYAATVDGRLTSIDPAPAPAFVAWAAQTAHVTHLAAPSLEVIAELRDVDAWLIDGDHNYYTVLHELLAADAACERDGTPLLAFVHDVGWPTGRRDMYYAPDRIPDAYRHAHEFGAGAMLDQVRLVPGQGFRGEDAWAMANVSGGPRNGVLTAVEDFIAGVGDTGRVLAFAHGAPLRGARSDSKESMSKPAGSAVRGPVMLACRLPTSPVSPPSAARHSRFATSPCASP
jgi:hypothetical protein